MDSKTAILNAVRRQALPPAELPSLESPANGRGWIRYDDRAAQFTAALESVGGRCLRVADMAAANEALAPLPCLAPLPSRARSLEVCSLVPGIGLPSIEGRVNIDLAAIDDPHVLESLDVAILPGEFAVAENGAVWVTDRGLRHRAVYFIPQHLVLIVPADAVLDNMHQAYERLSFTEAGFGVFISGPSKTADIEQSLVIGAHGPRSLTVVLVGGAG
jgi:L-lactate dehydrogenase complex protein LldG